jgi:hypothetical protein
MTTTMSELNRKAASRSDRDRFRDILDVQLPPTFATGHRQRDDGWLFGNNAFDECGIVRSVSTVKGDFLADAEALLAARLERVSLDDICAPGPAQPPPSTTRSP